MPKGKSTKGLADKRRTLDYKLKRRANENIRRGMKANWAVEALDAYLDGMNLTEIAQVMGCGSQAVGIAIAKEALFRLMAQHQADRLEDMGLDEGQQT